MHISSLTGYSHVDDWTDVPFIIVILSVYHDAMQPAPRMNTCGTDLRPARPEELGSATPQSEDELPRQAFPHPAEFHQTCRSACLSINAYGRKSWSFGVFCNSVPMAIAH